MKMSTKRNLSGSSDPYYRYKRDSVEVKIVQKGFTTSTKILNLMKIMSDLDILHRGIPFQSAAMTKILKAVRVKTGIPFVVKSEIPVFSGTVSVELIESIIDGFTNKYLMCKRCNVPELAGDYCRACGGDGKKDETKSVSVSEQVVEAESVSNEVSPDAECLHKLYAFRDAGHQVDDLIDMIWSSSNPVSCVVKVNTELSRRGIR
jgi:hypothetical protein